MSREGLTPEVLIEKIGQSRTIYLMDTEDVLKLHERGVSPKVIDAMLETRIRDLERQAAWRPCPYCDPWGPCCGPHAYVHSRWCFQSLPP